MIHIYSKKEIELLKKSGEILSRVLNAVAAAVRPGITTYELDVLAEKLIRSHPGAEPAFLGHKDRGEKPFPASLCTSVNSDLVHCVPSKRQRLKNGDIIGLDLGVKYKGYYTDMAVTVGVGKISTEAKGLIGTTQAALADALAVLRPNATLGDVGYAVQRRAEKAGFAVIRDLVGHGVGLHVHEDPPIPNFGKPGEGVKLQTGMVLAIEPMFAAGKHHLRMRSDGWGIKMADNQLCVHFEKTMAITENGYVVLTP